MARPRLHHFPPDEMLRRIAGVIQAKRDALESKLAAALADQAAENEAADKHEAERVAAGLSYWEWAQIRKSPERGDGWHREYDAKRSLADLAANGVCYDLPLFTGRNDLTGSARIAIQKSIRQLERDGLVSILGERALAIKLTPAGLAAVQEPVNV